MAAMASMAFMRRLYRPQATRTAWLCIQCRLASTASSPPFLLRLRDDLKSAMKAKDTNRLSVVRGLLNEVANAAKTPQPIKTDLQMLSLMRKRTAAAQTASKEFKDAGRTDLSEREDAQIAILDEYASGVDTMGSSEIRDTVAKVLEEMKSSGSKVTIGDVSKRLFAPGGDFDGKPVEKSEVIKALKDLLPKE